MGIQLAFKPAGIVIALIFIGLPFVVRTVQPVLEDAEKSWKKPPPAWAPRAADFHQGHPALHHAPRCSPALPWRLRGRWVNTAR